MDKKILILNADNFTDMEGFYCEIDNIFTKDLDWQTGHNLDAFNDLCRGGFGVFEYEEPIKVVWEKFEKSKNDLGRESTILSYESKLPKIHPANFEYFYKLLSDLRDGKGETYFDIILDILKSHEHIELELK